MATIGKKKVCRYEITNQDIQQIKVIIYRDKLLYIYSVLASSI